MFKSKKSKRKVSSENFTSLLAYLSFNSKLADDDLLRLVLEIGVGMMKADQGSLLLLDREKEELEFMMTFGSVESGKQLNGQRFPIHQGITGLAASTGEPQTGSPSYHGIKQYDRGKGHRREPTAVLAAPMLVEDEVVGVITAVSFQEGRTFSSEDVELYCKFASLCGSVIRQRLREAAVCNILMGKKVSRKVVPEIQQVLASRGLNPSDRAVVDIAKTLGELSLGREEVLPICSTLVNNIVQLAKELGWKV